MKRNKPVLLLAVIIIVIMLNSCMIDGEEEAYFCPQIIVMNIDGTDQQVYGGVDNSYPVSMNNNDRFIQCSDNIYIWDIETKRYTKYLEDIEVDHEEYIYGTETIGVSYDDNYIAFTSDEELYYLDISTRGYEQLTSNHRDEFPKFGIDGKIYFSRKDGDNYKLMSIDIDGDNLTEICTSEHKITHIYPGQVDSNLIYYVCDRLYFNKVQIDTGTSAVLYEFPNPMSVIGRSNDDQFFSFSPALPRHYLYNTSTNIMQTYLNNDVSYGNFSKILPNQSKAIVKNQWGGAVLRLWNIECNSQIGETIIIEHTREFGCKIFCFTPDGEKVIFIHMAEYNWRRND